MMDALEQSFFLNEEETQKRLFKTPAMFNELQLNGIPVIQSCVQYQHRLGRMAIDDSTLLFVLKGINTIRYGDSLAEVYSNEMIMLPKGILIEYDKMGDPNSDNLFEALYFVFKEDLLKEFLTSADLKKLPVMELESVVLSAKPVSNRLQGFLESVSPLLRDKDNVTKDLIKLKILELLHHLLSADKEMLLRMMPFKKASSENLISMMEQHCLSPIKLPELAVLTGRSLSTFKREFEAIYKYAPAKWIKERKLEKAKEFLQNTSMSMQLVCKTSGFTNVSHFSRAFKKHFGYPPSLRKQAR